MKKEIITAAAALAMAVPMTAQIGTNPQWLDNAVFYQIYPSSYMDTDGNGI